MSKCEVITKNGEVVRVSVDYMAVEFLVINKALKLMTENNDVNIIDRTTADILIKEFNKALKK